MGKMKLVEVIQQLQQALDESPDMDVYFAFIEEHNTLILSNAEVTDFDIRWNLLEQTPTSMESKYANMDKASFNLH
jgi:hypothetical protein